MSNCFCCEETTYCDLRSKRGKKIRQYPQLPEAPKRWHKYINFRQCPICQTIWQIDEYNQSLVQLAIRIPKGYKFNEFDDTQARIDYLVFMRGGYENRECLWVECKKECLKDLNFCEYHTYHVMGLRK